MAKQSRGCGNKHLANVRYSTCLFTLYERSAIELDIEILVAVGCLQVRIFVLNRQLSLSGRSCGKLPFQVQFGFNL
jgi:hypothetical protein